VRIGQISCARVVLVPRHQQDVDNPFASPDHLITADGTFVAGMQKVIPPSIELPGKRIDSFPNRGYANGQ
jgi:hypothetical protein